MTILTYLKHAKTRLRSFTIYLGTAVLCCFGVYFLFGLTVQSSVKELGALKQNLIDLREVYRQTMIGIEAFENIDNKHSDDINNHIFGDVDANHVIKSLDEYREPTQTIVASFRAGLDVDEVDIELNPEYKNPCWFFRGRKLRCLPSVYIIGFPFCNAIDLWYKITKHPGVLSTPIVENTWWTRLRYQDVSLMKYGRYYARLIESTPGVKQKLIVQSSPQTMWDVGSINMAKSFGAPAVLQAHIMRGVIPSTKLVVMMRDPTQRIFMEFLGQTDIKKEGALENFHEIAKDMIRTMHDCFHRRTIRDCAYDTSIFPRCHDAKGCIQSGMYVIFVSDWLRVFPREQFLFIRSEDTSTHREVKGVLRRVINFVSLENQHLNGTIDNIANKAPPSLEGSAMTKYANQPMLMKTRKMLDDFYRPFNDVLCQVLNDTKYSWHIKPIFENGPRSRDIFEKDENR